MELSFQGSAILLDIEGTTSSIDFVHGVLFPYARERLASFLSEHWGDPNLTVTCERIARDAGASLADWQPQPQARVIAEVNRLMDADAKTIGLKALQALIWNEGYQAGQLHSHVYDDVAPALKQWHALGIVVSIFSSGSIAAQKMYFGRTPVGDLLPYFRGHYDLTIGSKREPASYERIAAEMRQAAADILFISDVPAELDAARTAGMRTVLAVRPGNAAVPDDCPHPRVVSFAEIVCTRRKCS